MREGSLSRSARRKEQLQRKCMRALWIMLLLGHVNAWTMLRGSGLPAIGVKTLSRSLAFGMRTFATGNAAALRPSQVHTKINKLKNVPVLPTSVNLLARAQKSAAAVKYNANIKNARQRASKYFATKCDTLMKGLSVPITKLMNAYEGIFDHLHPFEETVAKLTLTARVKKGRRSLEAVFDDLKSMRAEINRICKYYAGSAKQWKPSEFQEQFDNCVHEVEQVFGQYGLVFEEAADLQAELRKIPVIDLTLPTMVLVGSPNVGKSSIIRAISSGTPEVNNYPFTTRGMTLGHLKVRDKVYQIMDSPGLLDRSDDERNEMELLTIASLAHLPTAVMFVTDVTGTSGEKSNLEAQRNVRKYLRERFPRRPWLDVISKHDVSVPAEQLAFAPEGALHVSVVSGHNMDKLLEQTIEKLEQIPEQLRVRVLQH